MALISVSNNALSNISVIPASIPTGSLTLIKSITASASANISFVHGTDGVVLDGTYLSYVFKFIDIHPSSASTRFQFNGSTDSGSNYNVTKTTTIFIAGHNEADTDATLTYQSGDDLAQSTGFQDLAAYGSSDDAADSSLAGTLTIYNPSNTTYVKHFIARTNYVANTPYSVDSYTAGYFNTTSAINAFRFQFTSNNIDDGIIKLYGVK